MELHENIKRIRESCNISQRELGRRIKMSGQMISKIEKNETTPSVGTLLKISDALNVSVYDLIRDTDEGKSINREIIKQNSLDIMGIIDDIYDGIAKDNKDLLLIKPLKNYVYEILLHSMNLLADSSTRPLIYNKLDHLFENFTNVLGNLDNLQVNGNNDDIMPILQNISAYLEERKLLSDKLIQANKIISNQSTKEGE